jgi:hypothetical protein
MKKRMNASGLAAGIALATTAVLLASGAANAASSGHGAPVVAPAPTSAPATSHSNGSCTTPEVTSAPPSTNTEKLMWINAHPTGLTAVWLPGLNSKRCVARRTVGNAALASRVAAAIERAKAFPTGPLPCPFDDNTAVRLYFSYATGGDEYADVSLDGCRPISAPDRASRWNDAQVDKALLPAAPAAWQSYLSDGAAAKPSHAAPVIETAPASAPVATVHNGACTVQTAAPGANAGAGKGLVWVRRHPTGVVALWIPGENSTKHCVARRTVDSAALASRMASAVDNAKAFPRGIFCPRDDGSGVRLYFTYANGQDEYVSVEFTGCHAVSAPGRSSREDTAAMSNALSQAAPPAWSSYFTS